MDCKCCSLISGVQDWTEQRDSNWGFNWRLFNGRQLPKWVDYECLAEESAVSQLDNSLNISTLIQTAGKNTNSSHVLEADLRQQSEPRACKLLAVPVNSGKHLSSSLPRVLNSNCSLLWHLRMSPFLSAANGCFQPASNQLAGSSSCCWLDSPTQASCFPSPALVLHLADLLPTVFQSFFRDVLQKELPNSGK